LHNSVDNPKVVFLYETGCFLSLDMQGKKDYQEELFTHFQLSDFVPEENFYRRLKDVLKLDYLYAKTAQYYGHCGQKSIDPVVFFKLCLVGYLENIISDRQLMQHCNMRMDIRYFLNYKLTEPMPWHSTMSRTRDLLPEALFKEVFEDILRKCIDGGLVSGHIQVIDSAPIKANASMDSLALKVPAEELDEHLARVRYQSTPDRTKQPRRKAKENKASQEQQSITATDRDLKEIAARNKNWQKTQDQRPGAQRENSKYTSNKTHYSPTDPDARISVKPGKARKLNYLSQLAVDPAKHVITHMGADFADKHDSRCLPSIISELQPRLKKMGVLWTTLLADTGYSSGANYAMLEDKKLEAFIPPHGTYKGGPDGFVYYQEGDYWLCRNNQKVTYRKTFIEKKGNNKKKLYLTKPSQCKGCPFSTECIGKSPERRITITYYKEEYERTKAKLKTKRGRRMKSLRQSVVEPVFGILTQFMGMRKLHTKGIKNANKQMLMAATAYNLKKLLKFAKTSPKSVAKSGKAGKPLAPFLKAIYTLILSPNAQPEYCI
jgi:transposase